MPMLVNDGAPLIVGGTNQDSLMLSKPISKLQKISAGIAHVLNLGTLVLVSVYCGKANKTKGFLGGYDWELNTFNWHPAMMVTGLLVCATEGLLAYRTLPFGKALNKKAHMAFQSAGAFCACVGLIAVFLSHNDVAHGGVKPNLYTAHGWIGILVVTLYFAQYAVGAVAYGLQLVGLNVRAALLPLHVFLGLFCYFGAMVAACAGIAEKTGFGGAYALAPGEVDHNPASHYGDIGAGYRTAFWLALCIIGTGLFATFAAMDLRVGDWKKKYEEEGADQGRL